MPTLAKNIKSFFLSFSQKKQKRNRTSKSCTSDSDCGDKYLTLITYYMPPPNNDVIYSEKVSPFPYFCNNGVCS